MLELLFQRTGYKVRWCNDPKQAIEVARELCPDIIITDIGMNGVDGYELARILKEDCGLPARIIALSGYTCTDDRSRSRYIDKYLLKPATFAEVQNAIAALCPKGG